MGTRGISGVCQGIVRVFARFTAVGPCWVPTVGSYLWVLDPLGAGVEPTVVYPTTSPSSCNKCVRNLTHASLHDDDLRRSQVTHRTLVVTSILYPPGVLFCGAPPPMNRNAGKAPS